MVPLHQIYCGVLVRRSMSALEDAEVKIAETLFADQVCELRTCQSHLQALIFNSKVFPSLPAVVCWKKVAELTFYHFHEGSRQLLQDGSNLLLSLLGDVQQ